jgi:tyrosinase
MPLRGLVFLAMAGIVLAGAVGCGGGGGPATESGVVPSSTGPVRIAVQDLTDQQRREYVDALLELKRMPSPFKGYERYSYYDTFVKWHRDSFFCNQQTAHSGSNFFPWHRYFIHLVEQGLSEAAGKPMSIPYWDFTSGEATNAVFRDDFMGGDGNIYEHDAVTSGPFRKGKWRLNVLDQPANDPIGLHHLVRNMGSFRGIATLPSAADVQRALAVGLYDTVPFDNNAHPKNSFRNSIEGWRKVINEQCKDGIFLPLSRLKNPPMAIHNRIHMYIGGIRGQRQGTLDLNSSPNDPVFWLIHSEIDRLWESWMRIHGRSYAPTGGWPRAGENLNDPMLPFKDLGERITPKMMLEPAEWGASYDELVELNPAAAKRAERVEPGNPSAVAPSTQGLASPAGLGFVCTLPVSRGRVRRD